MELRTGYCNGNPGVGTAYAWHFEECIHMRARKHTPSHTHSKLLADRKAALLESYPLPLLTSPISIPPPSPSPIQRFPACNAINTTVGNYTSVRKTTRNYWCLESELAYSKWVIVTGCRVNFEFPIIRIKGASLRTGSLHRCRLPLHLYASLCRLTKEE